MHWKSKRKLRPIDNVVKLLCSSLWVRMCLQLSTATNDITDRSHQYLNHSGMYWTKPVASKSASSSQCQLTSAQKETRQSLWNVSKIWMSAEALKRISVSIQEALSAPFLYRFRLHEFGRSWEAHRDIDLRPKLTIQGSSSPQARVTCRWTSGQVCSPKGGSGEKDRIAL